MDHRSPQDMIEDFVASQSLVAPWAGPANDMREVVENHPMGPTSEYHILPEIMRVPAMTSSIYMIARISVSYRVPAFGAFDGFVCDFAGSS